MMPGAMAFISPLAVNAVRRRPRVSPVCGRGQPSPSFRRIVVSPFSACAEPPKTRYKGAFASNPDSAEPLQKSPSNSPAVSPTETPPVSLSVTPSSPPSSSGDGSDEAGRTKTKKPVWRRVLEDDEFEDLRYFGVSFAIALVFRALVLEPRFIPSESMVPTFEVGDQLLVEKVSKWIRPARPGDIVVFQPPPALTQRGYASTDAFIKRVVGGEGDTVRVRDGHIERNGVVVDEAYIAEGPKYEWGPATVPPGYVMVLGDNRNNSYDSHIWGFLPKSNIIGRAIVRYWPFARVGSVMVPSTVPANLERPDISPLLK